MTWYDTSSTIPGPFLRGRNEYESVSDEDGSVEKRGILKFANYEEYLDSLVLDEDVIRLENYAAARMVAALGCRCTGMTLTEKKLLKLQTQLREKLHPKRRNLALASERVFGQQSSKSDSSQSRRSTTLDTVDEKNSVFSFPFLKMDLSLQDPESGDPLIRELAIREKANRVGVLATIIFIREFNAAGHELSGYIDYGHRLETEKWIPYFSGRKKLMPNAGDLVFVHWKHGTASWKSSRNYKVILDHRRGLIFQHNYDRKTMSTDPKLESPGCGTLRVVVNGSNYAQVVLYDHLVRKKL